MVIRELVEKDLEQLLELYTQLDPATPRIDMAKAKETLHQITKTEMIKYLVIEEDDSIIGSCYLAIIPNMTHNCRSIGFIENVIIDEKHRGKGFGEQIIKKAIEYSKKEHCYKVILQSGVKRTRAHAFYEKLGFDSKSKIAFDLRLTVCKELRSEC